MIYLLYGSQQQVLVNKELKKLVNSLDKNASEFSSFSYSLEETPIDDIILDCLTMPIIDESKIVIAKDAFIFQPAQSKPKVKIDHNLDKLLEYIKNPSTFTNLIFVVNGNVDEKNKLFQEIKDRGQLIKVVDVEKEEWDGVINQLIDQYHVNMDNDAKREFVNRTQGELNIVINELKKLKHLDEPLITKDIVINFVSRPLEDNMIGMMDAILAKDYNEVYKIYFDLKRKSEEPIRMIYGLATQFKFIYQVAVLAEEGFSNDEIAKKFQANVKPGRIYYTLKKIRQGTKEEILDILDKLATLDKDIKSGVMNKYNCFELFLASLKDGE